MPVPQFKDLGKKAKDLFKKQYDYKNEIKTTNTTSGVKIETGGCSNNGLSGYTKANWTDDYLGDIEIEAGSCGKARGQFKLKDCAPGVNLTVSGACSGSVSLETNYAQDMIAATICAQHNLSKGCTGINASAVVGMEGFSLGGSVALDASGSPEDYSVGAQYATKDLVAALTTAKKGEEVNVNVFNQWSSSTSLAASVNVKPSSGDSTFGLGSHWNLNRATSIRAKVDSNGVVGTAITHTLASPNMKVGVSSQYNALSNDAFKAQKFGMSFSFGDF
jgi:voltage-dependent anion channel protein 2